MYSDAYIGWEGVWERGKLMGTKREFTYINEKGSCGNRKIETYFLFGKLQHNVVPNGQWVVIGNKNARGKKKEEKRKEGPTEI